MYMEQSTPFPVCLLAKDVMSLHAGILVTPEPSSVAQAGGVIQGGLHESQLFIRLIVSLRCKV